MVRKPAKKTLKLKKVIEEKGKINEMSEHVWNAEQNEIIKYNKKFDKSIIEKLTLELFNDMQDAINKKFVYFENEEQLLRYQLILIIKHFSHFKDEIGEAFEDKITALDALESIGLFDLFFEELFDVNEVAIVINKINLVAEKAMVAMEMIEKARQESAEDEEE